ncbi:MAG TPA: dTDP-4-dehydrorhamnose reductase [Dehalococcoidia bacterium]|nr:dTDP-4-dehydrorhamnose reductase [Dehalococcoidia bacterium]
MRVLITGGHGQLGRALQQALREHEVLAPGHAELDVTDPAVIERALAGFRPEAVIHAAAWTDTAGCEADPQRALLVNGEGTRLVAEACRDVGAVMLYVSTNEIFDGEKREPYTEADEPNPLNSYGRSKLAGERYVQAVLARYYIVRTAWLYGAGRVSFPEKVLQAADKSGALKGVTDEIASPTWVADLAGGIAGLLWSAPPGVYHLTNGGHCSRLEWMVEILRLANRSDVKVEPATQAEFDLPYRKPVCSALSLQKAGRCGIEMPPWPDALARYMAKSE